MSPAPPRSVRNPPPRPLLIFDGTCHFCRRWIERWRELTAGAIDYAPSQEVAQSFPEIPPEAFERSVQFIETDGTVFSGAEAVFRSLAHNRRSRWMLWCYKYVPGFSLVTETAYCVVARNRQFFSFFTRLLWGQDVRRPTWYKSRDLFLRSLGGLYLIAFLSLWLQVDGLIGSQGISPIAVYLSAARDQLGGSAPFLLPTLCWFDSSNAFLHFLCGAGAVVSVALIAGLAPVLSLTLLFILYLSLTVAGQTFLSFQWDILLLEAGFLAIFFAPFRWALNAGLDARISPVGQFLLKLLLFKLMLMSGVVKLTSGDDSWWNLTALNYHYETQPLPTVFGWWAHQGPEWTRKFSTFFVLFVECVTPFFIWSPRRLRHGACALLIFLQVVIALTGNYCFFNLLTIALCLLLIDDAAWRPKERRSLDRRIDDRGRFGTRLSQQWPALAVLLVTLPLNAVLIFSAFKPKAPWPRPIQTLYGYIQPVRVVNGYGLFRVMTKSRPEIILEGSADGIEWLPYEFHWKPGDLNQPPHWAAPHQPRLDWQMWFAALGTYRHNPWFVSLTKQLLENNREVIRLLAHNPFPNKPPLFVRSTVYDYHFTSVSEHRATGAWWKREERGEYLPAISLRDFRN